MRAKRPASSFSTLEKTVIKKGLCTACGTCVGVCPQGLIDIGWIDGDAEPYLARPPCPECGICVEVCPGKDIPLLQLEGMVFGKKRDPERDKVGLYEAAFSVQAVDVNVRQGGAAAPELGIEYGHIIKGVYPFITIVLVVIALCVFFPQIVLWLPAQMIR